MFQTRLFKKVGEKTVHNKMEKFKIEVTLFLQSIIKIELNFESNFATPTQITFKNNFWSVFVLFAFYLCLSNHCNAVLFVQKTKKMHSFHVFAFKSQILKCKKTFDIFISSPLRVCFLSRVLVYLKSVLL